MLSDGLGHGDRAAMTPLWRRKNTDVVLQNPALFAFFGCNF
jgi:hypothetical protein